MALNLVQGSLCRTYEAQVVQNLSSRLLTSPDIGVDPRRPWYGNALYLTSSSAWGVYSMTIRIKTFILDKERLTNGSRDSALHGLTNSRCASQIRFQYRGQ